MNWLLLILCLVTPFLARAGVTIHFEGEAKDNQAVDTVIAEATAFAVSRQWRVEPVSKDKAELERVKDEKSVKYIGAVRGVILYPHDMCEPIRLEFGSDHSLQDFCKTQFAGLDVHIAVVELLRCLKPHFIRLEVEDEGEYWEASERPKLERHINTVNRMLEEIIRQKPFARGPVKLKSGRIADVIE